MDDLGGRTRTAHEKQQKGQKKSQDPKKAYGNDPVKQERKGRRRERFETDSTIAG